MITIVVIVIVILLIALVIGIVVWAKRNEKWCFKVRYVAGADAADPRLEEPLAEGDPNERPIVRAPPRPNN